MFWWIKNSFWTFIPGHTGNHSHCTAQCTDIIGSLQFSLYFHLLLGEEHLNVITMQSFTLHGRGNIPQGSVDFKAKCAQGENIVKEIELVHLLPHTFKATNIFIFKTFLVEWRGDSGSYIRDAFKKIIGLCQLLRLHQNCQSFSWQVSPIHEAG